MKLLIKIYIKIKQYLIYKIFKLIIQQREKKFEKLFNLFAKFNKSIKIKVLFIDNNYFIIDKNKTYKLFPIERINIYVKDLEYRTQRLKKEYLLDNLKFEDDDIIIDIGANNGDFYLCFNNKINYYGYEPSPIVFSNLKYNVKNQHIFNLGLSNVENKGVDFYLNDEFGDSSILPINNYSKKISIETTTLDKEIDKIQKKIKLIKLEAEGFEIEILHGLKKYLNKVEYIVVDCGFERGLDQNSTIAECSNYLINNNFKMIDFGVPRIVTLFQNLNYQQ